MRRKFASNLIFLIASNLLVKPYWIFGIDRTVQNRVGIETFGTFFAVFNYTLIISILLDFGINNFNNRAISRSNKRLDSYLLNLMLLKFLLGILYLVVAFIFSSLAGITSQQLYMLLFLCLNQILLSAILYFRSNIAALQLFKTDSVISILDKLLSIAFCATLLYAPAFSEKFNIMWFIYAQTLALLITALVAFAIVAGRASFILQLWKGKFALKILLKSMPFAMLILLMGLYYRIDALMIKKLLPNGDAEVGIYAASFRLLDAVNQFGYLFATLLLPLFATMIRKRDNLRPLVKFSSELIFAGSVVVAVCCYFFSAPLMQLMYTGSTPYWERIFAWLMITFIPMSSVYIFGTLLTAKGSLKILNGIAIGGAIVNIALNFVLIPRYGALGATFDTLVTQSAVAIAHLIAANREFNFEYEVLEIGKMLLFAGLCVAIVFGFTHTSLHWMLSFVLSAACCGLLVFVLRIVPLNNIKSMLANWK